MNPRVKVVRGSISKEDAQVDVPITMALAESSETVRPMMNATQIPWSVEGTCHFQLPSTPVGVDFSQAGQWDKPLSLTGFIAIASDHKR